MGVKIKIAKVSTVKISKGPKDPNRLIQVYNFQDTAGREVEIDEKKMAYVDRALTMFVKAQEILDQAYLEADKPNVVEG